MHTTTRRPKLFGLAGSTPLSPTAKARIFKAGLALAHRDAKEIRGDRITRADLDVLRKLLWRFHNGATGHCFPSYDKIAEAAHCSARTVARSIKRWEDAGILTWVNRCVRRVRQVWSQLLKRFVPERTVERTSNAYAFLSGQKDQASYTCQHDGGTRDQVSTNPEKAAIAAPPTALDLSIAHYRRVFANRKPAAPS